MRLRICVLAAALALAGCGSPSGGADPTTASGTPTGAPSSSAAAWTIPGTLYYSVGGDAVPEVRRLGPGGLVQSVAKLTAGSARGFRVSPDGTKVSFADRRGTLTVVNADGTNPRELDNVAIGPDVDWSPDSRRLVYAAYTQFDPDVRVIGADGSGRRVLGKGLFPVWSPDGGWISFMALGLTRTRLTTMRVDGSGSRTVTVSFPQPSQSIWGIQSLSTGGTEAFIAPECPDCSNSLPDRFFKGALAVNTQTGAARTIAATGGTVEMVLWLKDGGQLVRIATQPAPPAGGWAVYDVEVRRPDGTVVTRAAEPTTLHGYLTTYAP